MLLYELAITLDMRSTELIDAAADLGMGELQTASDLDAQQVAALRAHLGGGMAAPQPLAPLGASTPLPAPPTAPLTFGAPPPPAAPPTGAPSAPAAWGPPSAPTSWGPPPGASRPAPPDPVAPEPSGEAAYVGPAFAYPDSPIAQDGAPAGAPAAAVLAPLPPPPGPVPGAAPPSSSGFGTGQKVVIGAVVLGVLALFAFMALNTGPDKSRQQAIAANDADLEAELNATTTPIVTTSEVPATTQAPSTPSAYDVVDRARFCKGGIGVGSLELRLAAALTDQDFAELSTIVRDRRGAWDADVADMIAGGAPIIVNDIELYRDGYNTFFDAIASSSTLDQAYAKVDRMQLIKAGNAGQEVSTQVANECN